MSPIRRRTFFGPLSDKKLREVIFEAKISDLRISNAQTWGNEIEVDLLQQNARDREIRMAAQKELERRQRRQIEGKELSKKRFPG